MTKESPGPDRWQKLGESLQTSTRIFDVMRTSYQHPRREKPQDFVVIKSPDWVNVIALTPDDQLVLVRQFRYGINDFSLEIPGGIIDPGEDPLAAATRELSEESGYVGKTARLLGTVHPNPAIQSNRCHLVLVENAQCSAPLDWDPDEEFEILTQPVDEVLRLARSGAITHALVLNALFLFAPIWEQRRGSAV